MLEREKEARFTMLETLADHDDELMEQLLEDIQPPRDKVFDDLAKELREGLIVPVLLGVATRQNGVLRLLKALRHEAPGVAETVARLGVEAGDDALALVLKTFHTTHGGKMSVARLLAGTVSDGTTFHTPEGEAGRVSGVFKIMGSHFEKRGQAVAGETVALGKLDGAKTGDTLSAGKTPHAALVEVKPYAPVLALAVQAKERKDDVKLGAAFTKLTEEDPSLSVVHNAENHEVVIWGQGEMHLRVAAERLGERYAVPVSTRPPSVGYKETIRKPVTVRGRHKKQSGGHGQFGDTMLEIKPLPRGSGFKFEDRITGGVVPRNYIPAVEEGVLDGLKQGPLGFPVVDLAVALIDGSYHTVDSSDMAFRIAGRIGIAEGLPQCNPVLLEPIHLVEIVCPNEATAKMNAILGRPARADSRLRHPRGLGGLGHRARADGGSRDRRPHHRGAFGHRRRRQLPLQVRPHGRTHRAHGRPDHRGKTGGGVAHCHPGTRVKRAGPESILRSAGVMDSGSRPCGRAPE